MVDQQHTPVKVKGKFVFSPEAIQMICDMYGGGIGMDSIGSEFGISRKAIRHVLVQHGVKILRWSSVDHTAFDVLTPTALYWIGFLIADGCVRVVNNSYTISMSLSIKDKDHVAKFKAFVKTSNVVSLSNNCVASLTVVSEHMFKRLCEFGVVPNKSTYEKAGGGVELNRHFWRGWVDGDGCLSIRKNDNRPFLSLCGSYDLMTQFHEFVKTMVHGYKVKLHPTPGGNKRFYQSHVSGKQAIQIIKILYSDCDVYLPRKMRIANSIISNGDGFMKGYRIGESATNSKLSETQVKEIRRLYPSISMSKLAKRFNVCLVVVWRIIHRKTWKHVS